MPKHLNLASLVSTCVFGFNPSFSLLVDKLCLSNQVPFIPEIPDNTQTKNPVTVTQFVSKLNEIDFLTGCSARIRDTCQRSSQYDLTQTLSQYTVSWKYGCSNLENLARD